MKNYAYQPSRSNQKYVKNSKGNKVRNIAYEEKTKTSVNSALKMGITPPSDDFIPVGSYFHDDVLHGLQNVPFVDIMRKMGYTEESGYNEYTENIEEYIRILNMTTATHGREKSEVHRSISGWLYMVGNALNDENLNERTKSVVNEKLEIIRSGITPIEGVIWRGIPTRKFSVEDTEFQNRMSIQDLDRYAEEAADDIIHNQKWNSYSLSPGVAYCFSQGMKKTTSPWELQKSVDMITHNVNDGIMIALINPTGYPLEYEKRHETISPNKDNNEYEVLVETKDKDILEVIPTEKSPFGKPIIVAEG